MTTHPHFLRAAKRPTTPVRQWFTVAGSSMAHSEGNTMVHRLQALDAVCGVRMPRGGRFNHVPQRFSDAVGFWDWVWQRSLRNCTPWLVCYNGRWLMHLLELEAEIERSNIEIVTNWDGSGPLFLRLRKPHPSGGRPLRLRVICHTNIWRNTPISEMAASIHNPEELGDEFDSASTAATADVLSRMMEGWTQALVDGDLGSMQPTIGRQAMSAVKRRVGTRELLVHGNPTVQRIERSAYLGGRVEARVGRYPEAYEADIPSCYPTIMQDWMMPGRLVEVADIGFHGPHHAMLRDYLKRFLVIASVTVEQNVPAIPRRIERGGASHPVGERFRAVLPTPWLEWALERDYIHAVGTVLAYEPTGVLGDLMSDLVAARNVAMHRGNVAGAQTLKVLANAVHGKMGQRQRKWEDVAGVYPPEEFWHGWFGPMDFDLSENPECYEWRWRDQGAQRLVRSEGFETLTAIAAHTSAHARLQLWELLDTADRVAEDGLGWYYADTDGLYVSRPARDALRRNGGNLRITGPFELEVLARKQYRKDGRLVAAGLPANARQMSPELWETDRWPAWQMGASDEPGRIRVYGQSWRIRGIDNRL